MTLKTKNIILYSSTIICATLFILHLVGFGLFPILKRTDCIILFLNSIFLLAGSIIIHIYYKKSLPSEIILYTVFLASFSLQSIRIIPLLIDYDTFAMSIIVGRTSQFLKYLSLLSLLGASLFSYTIKKQKVGTWLLSSILCSFVVSSFMHFNTGVMKSNLLPSVIFKSEDIVITSSIIIIIVSTFIKTGFDAKNVEFFFMAGASLALCLSILLSFITLNLISGIIMIILLILGSIFYLRSMHNITLWA